MVPRWISCTCFITSLLLIFALSSHNDLDSITVITHDEAFTGFSGSEALIHVTLWFNFTIYQYTLDGASTPIVPAAAYVAYRESLSAQSSICDTSPRDTEPETKLMIENSQNDAIPITSLIVTTASGIWYGINGICTEGPMAWKSHRDNWFLNDTACEASQEHYQVFCSGAICAPNKQILYFNTTKPNEYISDALWVNANGTVVAKATCDPTHDPTTEPTLEASTASAAMNLTTIIVAIVLPSVLVLCACVVLMVWLIISKRWQPSALHPTDGLVAIGLESKRESDPEFNRVFSASTGKTVGANDTDTTDIVLTWLEHTLELPQYVDCFIKNGYNSMRMMKEIKSKSQLQKIGIRKKGHQTFIMSEIDKLRAGNGGMSLKDAATTSAGSSASNASEKKQSQYDIDAALVDWCTEVLVLGQYVTVFTQNGYPTLQSVKKIKHKRQLIEIGIVKKGHQVLIMDEIDKLASQREVRIQHAPGAQESVLYGIVVADRVNEAQVKAMQDSSNDEDDPDLPDLPDEPDIPEEVTPKQATRTARDAMKNDKIALGIISTKKGTVRETRQVAPSVIKVRETIRAAMKQDPIARRVISTDKGSDVVIRHNAYTHD